LKDELQLFEYHFNIFKKEVEKILKQYDYTNNLKSKFERLNTKENVSLKPLI
jgi:hypothetical protein